MKGLGLESFLWKILAQIKQLYIIRNTSDIQKFWKDGFRVTACAARGSTFYIIVTKSTKEYGEKSQEWITGNTWLEVDTEIRKSYRTGKFITGICYSTGLEQYFVVMTEMSQGPRQCYAWQTDSTKEGYFKREKEKWEGISSHHHFQRSHWRQDSVCDDQGWKNIWIHIQN